MVLFLPNDWWNSPVKSFELGAFFFVWLVIIDSISWMDIGLFTLSTWCFVSIKELVHFIYLSKLWAKYPFIILFMLMGPAIWDPSFISTIGLPFILAWIKLMNCIDPFKELVFGFVDFLYCSPIFYSNFSFF